METPTPLLDENTGVKDVRLRSGENRLREEADVTAFDKAVDEVEK